MDAPKRLFDFPYYQLEKFPLDTMMTSKSATGWTGISTADFVKKMNLVSRGLLALGLKPGDRVALITHVNRTEWDIMDNAILQVGGVDVPIYPTMTESDYQFILNHAGARFCFVSNKELYDRVKAIQPQVPLLEKIFTFDKVEGASHWEEVIGLSQTMSQAEVDARAALVKEEDMATIIYTSGTTGLPKGVMLSHRNIASNALASEERLPHLDKRESRAASFLPICHIFERMLHYLYMANGVTIYQTGMDAIKDDLNAIHPHIFTAVPRLLEKVYEGIYAKGMANTGIKKTLFTWAHDLAMQWEPDRRNGWWYEVRLSLARKLVFSKVKAALGLTEIKAIASGSAALQPRLARFFCGAGIWVKEGYGLTETSPVIAVNALREPHMWEAGTVGKPIRHVEVRIATDGEILCKGPNVMMGYYNDPEKTAEVMTDGWFHTGDIGEIRNGFIAITDRKKEMFKTSGGKYVAPQVIENAIKESPYIEQVMVIGDGQKFPAALVVPEIGALTTWAAKNKIAPCGLEEMIQKPEVVALIQSEINRCNVRFGHWEQVKAIRLLAHPFSISGGELTPTLKLKRKVIMEHFKKVVEGIYLENGHVEST